MKAIDKLTLSVILLSSVAMPARALAQSQSERETAAAPSANDIVVTAQRRAERLENVPIAITAATGAMLERSGIQRVTDLGQIAAGVQVNRGGSFNQPSVRGVTTLTLGYGFENNVALYIDGLYQVDAISIQSDLVNLSSLQVLKGPQGALYGRNATAGAIIIETLAPAQDAFTGNGQISYGRFDDKRAKIYLSGPLSDNLAFSIAANYRSNDGYITDIGADPVSKSDDRNAAPLRNRAVRAKLLFTPTDNLSITLGYNYNFVVDSRGAAYRVTDYPSTALPKPPGRATARDTTSLNVLPDSQVKAQDFNATIKFDTEIGTLSSYTGYSKRHFHSNFDFDASRTDFTSSISEGILENTFQQTLDYAIDAIDGLDLTVGMFFYRDRLGVNDGQSYAGGVLQRRQFVYLESDAMATYADATWHISNRLHLTGSVRVSTERRRIHYYELTGNNPLVVVAPPADKNANFDSVDPRAVLRYELGDRTNIYASFSQGFRAGVFNPTPATNPALVIPVKPERIKSYEAGFKTANSKMRFDIAAYYLDFRDLQVGVTVPNPLLPGGSPIQLISNAKRAESYGFESQFAYTPMENLNLRLGIAYIHARYKDFKNATGTGLNATTQTNAGGQVQDWSGQQMARAPTWTGNAGVDYTTGFFGGELNLAANASYTSSYVVANPSLYGPLAGAALANKQRYRQGAYGLLNLQANWTDPSGHLTLGVYGDNVTNTRYRFIHSGGAFGDYSQYNEPVSYGVRAGFKF